MSRRRAGGPARPAAGIRWWPWWRLLRAPCRPVITAAVDAVITSPQALRDVSAALAADPRALAHGAPPVVGRLVTELMARGSATLAEPACVRCGWTGRPLTATGSGGMCGRCRHRELAEECAACGKVRPVAWHDEAGRAGARPAGSAGRPPRLRFARAAGCRMCVNCYQLPRAVCTRCGRERPCNSPRSSGLRRLLAPGRGRVRALRPAPPPTARWPEGPVCDPCYNAALRSRG